MAGDAHEQRMAPYRRAFGERIRGLRSAQNLSQEALARKAGIYPTYLSSVERGQRNISLENIHALADALGVDVRSLFGGGEPA